MSNILILFADGIINYLLFTSVITVVLTSLAVVIIKMARIKAPVYRHQVWLYCLIGIIFLPAICLYGPKFTLAVLPAHIQADEVVDDADGIVLDIPVVEELSDETYLPIGADAEKAAEDNHRPQTFTTKNILAMLWFVGVVLMATRLMVGWYRLRRVCLSAEAVSGNGCLRNRNVRILLTSQVKGPVCFGLFRGIILLPHQIYENTATDKLEMILNHELAHIERKDYLANLFQRVVEAGLFFHPFLWYASLQLTQQREQICDNYVLTSGASTDDYTALLAQIVERGIRGDQLGAVALIEGRLLSRVRFLLNPDRSKKIKLSIRAVFVCTVAILTAFGIFGTVRITAKTQAEASLMKQRRESAEKLMRLGAILAKYIADHDGKLPGNKPNMAPYIGSEENVEQLARFVIGNVEFIGDGEGKVVGPTPGKIPMAYDRSLLQQSQGTNVLFADGHVEFLTLGRLKGFGIEPVSSHLRVVNVDFEPIRQGKNTVHVKVQNISNEDRVFRMQIYTRSPDYGEKGVGWGTSFFDTVKTGEMKSMRFVFKIQGPVTDSTYVRLDFHNPGPAEGFDVKQWWQKAEKSKWFKRIKYSSDELNKYDPESIARTLASEEDTTAVKAKLKQIQEFMRNKKYEQVWRSFTQDYQDAEFQLRVDSFERFKKAMEPKHPLDSAFVWEKEDFLKLRPKKVFHQNDLLSLEAFCDNQIWVINFVQEDGQWKIDWISGYIPRILLAQNWEERLLTKLQKHRTEHFDIYYFKDSTAEKESEQLAVDKERGFNKICQFLKTPSDTRIRLVLFEDGKRKHWETGHQGNGWAFGNTIVEVYNEKTKLDPYHETVHILMRPFGNPPALFNEGFAVYMSERLGASSLSYLGGGESKVYERVKELRVGNELWELKELIGFTEIGSMETRPPVAYPQAASFVKFLIETYGKDKFFEAYKALENGRDSEQNIERLERICNRSFPELEREWTAVISE